MSVPTPSVILAVKVRPATSSAQTVLEGFTVTTGFLSSSTFIEITFDGDPPVGQ